jgi:hypothetical protein
MFVVLPPILLLVYGCVVVKCEKTNQYHCTKTINYNKVILYFDYSKYDGNYIEIKKILKY